MDAANRRSQQASGSVDRLRDAARTLSRMPEGLASAIEVVEVDIEPELLVASTAAIAREFGLEAVVDTAPPMWVRFERG